jgi:cytochrome c-type biogenesis protein CcmH/NrfG
MTIRLPLRAALAAVCVAGAALCTIAYVSETRFQHALDTSLQSGDYQRALRDVRASDSPLNPSAHREGAVALALLVLGRPAAAEREAAGVTRREPGNVDTWVLLARIRASRNRLPGARAAWARARRLDPRLPAAPPAGIPAPSGGG